MKKGRQHSVYQLCAIVKVIVAKEGIFDIPKNSDSLKNVFFN